MHTTFELTICFETNLIKLNEYKTNKYDDLCREATNRQVKLKLPFIKISCVGFTSNNLKPFSNLIKTWGVIVNQLVSKCAEVHFQQTWKIMERERCIKICVIIYDNY